jgi:hypothetical protein
MSDKPKKVSIEETLSKLSAQRVQALANNDQSTAKKIDLVIKRIMALKKK